MCIARTAVAAGLSSLSSTLAPVYAMSGFYRFSGERESYVVCRGAGARVPIRMWTDPASVEDVALRQLQNVAALTD